MRLKWNKGVNSYNDYRLIKDSLIEKNASEYNINYYDDLPITLCNPYAYLHAVINHAIVI